MYLLHNLTRVEQRITSEYHLQSNGFVKRQNRTIKNALVKVLVGIVPPGAKELENMNFTKMEEYSVKKYLILGRRSVINTQPE